MEGVQKGKERNLEHRNFLEPCCQPWEHVKTMAGEGHPPSLSSETPLEPQNSDCFPSVILATLLTLVFALVSSFLLWNDNGHLPLGDCRASRFQKGEQGMNQGTVQKGPCPSGYGLGSLRLLFPNQPEITWQTLRKYVSGEQKGIRPDGTWVLAVVESGGASNTFLCFMKATLSLLTGVHAMHVRCLEKSSSWLPWFGFLKNETLELSTTEIYVGSSLFPYGIMVTWRGYGNQLSFKMSLGLLVNVVEPARAESVLQILLSSLLSGGFRFADWALEEFMTPEGSLPVLWVKPEQHLESGFVC